VKDGDKPGNIGGPGSSSCRTGAGSILTASKTSRSFRALDEIRLDGDADRIAALLTEDFTLTDSSGVVTTRADDIEHARKETIRYEIFENHDMKVRLHGGAA
jgi:hypothetical protein